MIATLLLTLIPADVSLYTVRGHDLYHVDLTSGDTEQVAHWDVSMNSVVWDSDQRVLFATSNGAYYKIDSQTWTPTQITTNVAGDGFASLFTATPSAYDPTTAMVWQYQNPLVLDTNNGDGFIKLRTINPSRSRGFILAYSEYGSEDLPPPHFPIGQDYLAANPIDGTLVTFSGRPGYAGYNHLFIRGPDYQQQLVSSWTFASTPLPGHPVPVNVSPYRGAIAFYPGTPDLYQYTYDGSGNAWLSTVDLTTGELTAASPPFTAPAWFMFFVTE